MDELLLQSATMAWRPKSLPGLYEKMLWRDEGPGPRKYEYTRTGVVLTPGSFYWNPKGNVHGPTLAHEETIVLEVYDGPHYPERPSWYADDQDAR